MRVLHMTDVHFHLPPRPMEVFSKRFLGLTNLYALGRIHHFDATALVSGAVQDALEQKPDLFVMTGDVTALATESEFELARRMFQPMIDAVPSVFVPGNHDAYVRSSQRTGRMERHFGDVMKGGDWDAEGHRWTGESPEPGAQIPWPARFRIGDVDVVATNPCRPVLRSTGKYPDGTIDRAEGFVQEARDSGRQALYLMHYPPLWSDGTPYDRPGHDIVNNDAVLASFRRAPPHLVLHGHNHTCWRTSLPVEGGAVPVLNCGTTSAVSPLPDRTAGYFVYELEGGVLRSVRRRMLLADSDEWQDHPSDFSGAAAIL
jgi:DNA repair exonuclease SbcCD nuclease subunit